jgi:energy-coupling factor transporter ATP-binding protein EcfA2
MINSQKLLILDEPTSGLDSITSYEVIKDLREKTETGMTIAVVIHQPSPEILSLFHKVILLNKGIIRYHDEPSKEKLFEVFQDEEIYNRSNPIEKVLEILSYQEEKTDDNLILSNQIDFMELFYLNDIKFLFTKQGIYHFFLGILLFFTQFFGCLIRSIIQQGRNVKNIFSDLILICITSFAMASIFSGDIYIGPLPDSISKQCGALQSICSLPGKDQILSSAASLNLAIVMLGSISGLKVFGILKILIKRK